MLCPPARERGFRGSCIAVELGSFGSAVSRAALVTVQTSKGCASHMLLTKENQHEVTRSVWAAVCLRRAKRL